MAAARDKTDRQCLPVEAWCSWHKRHPLRLLPLISTPRANIVHGHRRLFLAAVNRMLLVQAKPRR